MAKRKSEPVTAADMRAALCIHYPSSEWAVLYEVGHVGSDERRVDLLAVNLWRSRGCGWHGVEIKISRSDWLRELKQPKKAEEIFSYLDYWWIAAGPDVVKPEELPPTWGLMELRGAKLYKAREAQRLSPLALSRTLVSGVLRRHCQDLDNKLAQAREEARAEALQQPATVDPYEYRILKDAHQALLQSVKEFQQRSGLDLDQFNGPSLGKAVQEYQAMRGYSSPGFKTATERIQGAVNILGRLHEAAVRDLELFQELRACATKDET